MREMKEDIIQRNDAIVRARAAGVSSKELARIYGLSGGRVRAIISGHEIVERDTRYLTKYGLTYKEYLDLKTHITRTGLTPQAAYHAHKRNALICGIQWGFTLKTWWDMWQASGKWHLRGRGHGLYVAMLKDPLGAYVPDNTIIVQSGAQGRRNS